jgi:CRISPR/Cas system-associated exonuclease Cas4 (RecB family)
VIDLQQMLAKSLVAHDGQRDRSKQVAIGPSSLGGCSRRVWHDLKRSEKINTTETLAAILGSFIHAGVEKAIRREDPFGDNFLIEIEVSHGDLMGHCDLFIKDQGIVVDWKSTTKKGFRYFANQQQRWQIQTYGWLLEKNGYEVKEVSLVGIPRDGNMADIKVHREPYDPAIAKEAIEWLEKIKNIVETDAPAPAPEKFAPFCTNYCSYFDPTGVKGCPSIRK